MSVGKRLLKVLTSYFASVLSVFLILLWGGFYLGDIKSLDWNGARIGITVCAVLMLPMFVLIGLPYMAAGYRSEDRGHRLRFVLIGGVIGALAAVGFSAMLGMPYYFQPFVLVLGLVAGVSACLSWVAISRVLDSRND